MPAVGFRVRCLVPQTNSRYTILIGRKKREFVLESALLAQHGDDFFFHQAAEFRDNVRLQKRVTLRTNMGLFFFSTKEVIRDTAFGLEDLRASLIKYQIALTDFLFAAAPPRPVL